MVEYCGCSTAVEHIARYQEVAGSIPTSCQAFSYSIFSYFPSPEECPKKSPKGGASNIMCCEKNGCLVVLPGLKQVQKAQIV